MNSKDFIESTKKSLEILGFWTEEYKKSILSIIESNTSPEIIRDMYISDLVMNGDKVLIKWNKRLYPLNDDEMEKLFGKGK